MQEDTRGEKELVDEIQKIYKKKIVEILEEYNRLYIKCTEHKREHHAGVFRNCTCDLCTTSMECFIDREAKLAIEKVKIAREYRNGQIAKLKEVYGPVMEFRVKSMDELTVSFCTPRNG